MRMGILIGSRGDHTEIGNSKNLEKDKVNAEVSHQWHTNVMNPERTHISL
jgi:hypothetical protein